MKNYQIEQELYLAFFGILILLAIVLIWDFYKQKQQQASFKNPRLKQYLFPEYSPSKKILKISLSFIAISFLILGVVNPRIGIKNYKKSSQSLDIVYLLDISKSMLAEDVSSSRLGLAKEIIRKSFSFLSEDQVSVVAYAGSAQVLFPLTNDFNIARMYVDNADPSLMSAQGTSLSYALEQGLEQFDEKSKSDKIMILLSDGEDHEGNLESIKSKLHTNNIQLLSIALGSEIGAPIPIYSNGVLEDYKKDQRNEVVISKRNKNLLSKLSNGQVITPSNSGDALEVIQDFISSRNRVEKEIEVSGYQYLFPFLTLLALILLVLNEFIFEGKTKWIFTKKNK